ncbi:MAG: imidazole glycerol phosphate synthase subunit HisH [Clostridia bacterium]|nr:imidazole glycerol phosphate synthase subunit HisH [Clostridia bacterium]
MVAIIDYGVGNLFSLKSSLSFINVDAVVTSDPSVIASASHIILPGVGAFPDAAAKLKATGLIDVIKAEVAGGKPLLGICLGMQMLCSKSFEYGECEGLDFVPGEVVDMTPELPDGLKVPHIGWNALKFKGEKSELYKYINEGDCVYFVHSFYAKADKRCITATTEYDIELTASIENGNVYGTQFHPEKSGKVGLNILRAFCEIGGRV